MIKEGQFDSVVILSPYFWNDRDDMWQTTHHISREFARLVPTILVEPPPQWNVFGEQYRGYRLLNCLVHSQTYSPRSNLNVFRRRGLPFGRWQFIRDFDLRRNAIALKLFLHKRGYTRPLLWHSFPYWTEPVVEAVNCDLFVYHCLDHSTREEEVSLVRRANAVFCVSETLVQRHRQLNQNTYLLPNGVDLNLFNREATIEKERPADLPVHRRLIGFVGSINCHVDIELLVQVAKAFPHDSVVLIGRVLSNETAPRGRQKEALATVMSLHNVRVLGFKPTIELPFYMQAFDVCLIPFLKNSFNQQADPLKFYQYLAMGKPIVTTTPVQVAQRYRALCYIADSTEEFIASISGALSEGNAENLTERRMAVARAHSWEALVAQACQVLKGMKGDSGMSAEGGLHAQE